jgi:hypothetical protein
MFDKLIFISTIAYDSEGGLFLFTNAILLCTLPNKDLSFMLKINVKESTMFKSIHYST